MKASLLRLQLGMSVTQNGYLKVQVSLNECEDGRTQRQTRTVSVTVIDGSLGCLLAHVYTIPSRTA